jgi:hypothetical protein
LLLRSVAWKAAVTHGSLSSLRVSETVRTSGVVLNLVPALPCRRGAAVQQAASCSKRIASLQTPDQDVEAAIEMCSSLVDARDPATAHRSAPHVDGESDATLITRSPDLALAR